jgi:hypothetical protein
MIGATSVIGGNETTDARTGALVRSLRERKPTQRITVAIAKKTVGTGWAILICGQGYRAVALF